MTKFSGSLYNRIVNFKIYYLIVPLALLLQNSCASSGPTRTENNGWTIGIGVGTIVDNEIGKAKDDAIDDAKRDAVKKVLGTMIRSRTEIDSGVFKSSELTAKSEGFIDTYEILDSNAISKYEYRVRIRAKVSKAKIEDAIEEIISQQNRPIMLVLIKENLFGKANVSNQSIAGTALETEFTEKGFPLVDRATFQQVRKRQMASMNQALRGNNNAAKNLGAMTGAEIVLVGNSTITSAGLVMEGSKLISIQCDVNVRVIETTTGAILATVQKHAAYPHINLQTGAVEAAKKATMLASKELIQDIMKKWKTGKVSVIDVAISGASYEQIKKLRSELLEKIRGVKAVYRKENTNNIAILQVEFEGNSFDLADRVLDANLSIPLKTGAVKRNYVEFKVR